MVNPETGKIFNVVKTWASLMTKAVSIHSVVACLLAKHVKRSRKENPPETAIEVVIEYLSQF
jgi:hypothetical protein